MPSILKLIASPLVLVMLAWPASTRAQEPLPPPPATLADDNPAYCCLTGEGLPELIGGYDSLLALIEYPAEAKTAGVEGRVIVQFVVRLDGRVSDSSVVRGLGHGLDEEALQVVEQARFRWPADANFACPRMALSVVFSFTETPEHR